MNHQYNENRTESGWTNAEPVDAATYLKFIKDAYEIYLTKLRRGEGEFTCPNPGCNRIINPDDDTEKVYKILGIKAMGEDTKEVAIQCRCGAAIKLLFPIPDEEREIKYYKPKEMR